MNGVEWFLEGAIRSKINMIYLFILRMEDISAYLYASGEESGINNGEGTSARVKSLSRKEGMACSIINICLFPFLSSSRYLLKCPSSEKSALTTM